MSVTISIANNSKNTLFFRIIYYWRASVASETLTGVTQSKIGDVYKFICIYVWTYVCHFVL